MTKQEMVKKSTHSVFTNVVSLDSYRKLYNFYLMKGDVKPSNRTDLTSSGKKLKSDKDRQKELAKNITKPR